MFEYLENWCQDENRHGDFLAAVLKAHPVLISNDNWEAKLWARFFCLSVYITMYLNDNQRTAFYEALGMNTRDFNQHVIIETNKSTMRVFPQVRTVDRLEWLGSSIIISDSPGDWDLSVRIWALTTFLHLTTGPRRREPGLLPAPR